MDSWIHQKHITCAKGDGLNFECFNFTQKLVPMKLMKPLRSFITIKQYIIYLQVLRIRTREYSYSVCGTVNTAAVLGMGCVWGEGYMRMRKTLSCRNV